ncbi:MAG TPA: TetR/AcrR family transcriptional regulator [Terracidiphilus sp.]|nr:TetR/AcrR family transcriptional regulator [Terracidiphilus sp.]
MTPDASEDFRRRQPKGDKRDRTRAKLLEAARTLIREKGHEHTTLEDIAERAGMTTGAIYGNFKNRDELFISLGQTYWPPIKPQVKPGANFAAIMRAMADATIAAIPDRSAVAVGRLTGLAYTLAHEEMRAQVREITAQSYAFGEQWLRAVTKEEELPMPAGQLVRVIHALIEGLVFQRLLTPDLVPDEVFRAAFGALAKKADHE